MGAQTKEVTIQTGRDAGKTFIIELMKAVPTEKWAMRAIMAMIQSGMEIPDDVASMGLAGVASMGIKAIGGIRWDLAEPLLDEMLNCIKIKEPLITRKLTDEDLQEVSTILKLRMEAISFHWDFYGGGSPLTSQESEAQTATSHSPITKMLARS